MGHVPFFVQVGMTDVFFWVHALRAYSPASPMVGTAGHSGGRRPGAGRPAGSTSIKKKAAGTGTKKGKGKGPVPPGRARRASSSSVRLSQSRCRRRQQLRLRQMCAAPNAPRAPARARHLFFLLAAEPTHPCSLLAVRLTRAVVVFYARTKRDPTPTALVPGSIAIMLGSSGGCFSSSRSP